MVEYLDKTTRIKFKIPYTGYQFAKYLLQIRVWYGWKTINSTYHSIHKSKEEMVLFLKETAPYPFYVQNK